MRLRDPPAPGIGSAGQRARRPQRGRVHPGTPAGGRGSRGAATRGEARRRNVWDLADHLRCSIIGTCLSAAELRRVLRKLDLDRHDASDHELHGIGVRIAGTGDRAGKLLQKALDERHAIALHRFARAQDSGALRALWREAVESGDIPGAYFAVLTHPAIDDSLMRTVFGEVHMLSHLVGAANRADIRRLVAQEREIEALRETIARQQERLLAMTSERDDARRAMAELRRQETAKPAPPVEPGTAELLRRLASAEQHGLALAARREEAEARAAAAMQRATEAEARAAAMLAELAAAGDAPPRAGQVLYVGGRPSQVPALRQGAARLGATLLHHDGGVEASPGQLAGLISRADLVVFPVDCVSHLPALAVKRLCRQAGRPFQPLRSSGVTSFLAALAQHAKAGGITPLPVPETPAAPA